MKQKPETRRVLTDDRTHRVKTTQIEWKLSCDYCNNEFWAQSRKAKYCSGNCRQLNYLDNKKLKAQEAAKKPIKSTKSKKK